MEPNNHSYPPLVTPDGKTTDLSRLVLTALSQLAALQGQIVSYRELKRLALNLNQHALNNIPLPSQIAALWCLRFPESLVDAANWPPKPECVPALWLSSSLDSNVTTIIVVLGVRSNGGLSYLDANGLLSELPPEQARLGRLLVLDIQGRKKTKKHNELPAQSDSGKKLPIKNQSSLPASNRSPLTKLVNWIFRKN